MQSLHSIPKEVNKISGRWFSLVAKNTVTPLQLKEFILALSSIDQPIERLVD
jgi:hypothetical protein